MELFILCTAVAYMLTGKFTKDTAEAAYKAGHEPPGVVKARMRHEHGGGRYNDAGRPTGPGGTRLLAATWWAAACQKAVDKRHDKLARWRAFYAEQAPQRDEAWRDKQRNKIAKQERRAERFAQARGLVRSLPERRQERQAWAENARRDQERQQVIDEVRQEAQETVAPARDQALTQADLIQHALHMIRTGQAAGKTLMTPEQWNSLPDDARERIVFEGRQHGIQFTERREDGLRYPLTEDLKADARYSREPIAPVDGEPDNLEELLNNSEQRSAGGEPATSADTSEQQGDNGAAVAPAVSASASSNVTAEEGGTVYQQAAQKLHNHADEVEGYMNAFVELGDVMAGVGWGEQVHGPLTDLRASLQQVIGGYRDLAERIRHQGDQVNDAYDEAPWAPDKAVLVS